VRTTFENDTQNIQPIITQTQTEVDEVHENTMQNELPEILRRKRREAIFPLCEGNHYSKAAWWVLTAAEDNITEI
jgi:hypothetical protein